MTTAQEKAKKIKCLICDIDGVLTNGAILISSDGNDIKAFNSQDGMGMQMLMSAGIQLAVITTSGNDVVHHRMKQIGIHMYFTGQVDKRNAYNQLKAELNLKDEEFAYIGDDLSDLFIIEQVGLGVAVANAVRQVKTCADWQTEQKGGEGAVRELCEFILIAQNKFDSALEYYLAGTQG